MDVRREGVGEGDNYMTEDHKVRSVLTLRRPYLTRETNRPHRQSYGGELHGTFSFSFNILRRICYSYQFGFEENKRKGKGFVLLSPVEL